MCSLRTSHGLHCASVCSHCHTLYLCGSSPGNGQAGPRRVVLHSIPFQNKAHVVVSVIHIPGNTKILPVTMCHVHTGPRPEAGPCSVVACNVLSLEPLQSPRCTTSVLECSVYPTPEHTALQTKHAGKPSIKALDTAFCFCIHKEN